MANRTPKPGGAATAGALRCARIEGGLLGMLIGDALGVPYEFNGPEQLPPLAAIDMWPPPGFRPSHSVPAGTWSDDGAQALALLASLLARGTLDLDDFGARLLRWWRAGEYAVDGLVFDIGIQTQRALQALHAGSSPERSGASGERDNGNGSLMRVLPLALWHRGSDAALIRDAMRSSLPTHAHLRSQLCCALYSLWARRVLAGQGHAAGWRSAVTTLAAEFADEPEAARELEIIDPHREPGGRGSGYVVDCLHSARAALHAGDFAAVLRTAVALGNDTDTTATVAGGIAGLEAGVEGIPGRWRKALRGREVLAPLLAGLLAHAELDPS